MTRKPTFCTLTPGQLREQNAVLLPGLVCRATSVDALEDGYQLRFDPSSETLDAIAKVIDAERQCCRFLRFELTILPDGEPMTLIVRGPTGTRVFLDGLFTSEPTRPTRPTRPCETATAGRWPGRWSFPPKRVP
jgi:hypothetical protein